MAIKKKKSRNEIKKTVQDFVGKKILTFLDDFAHLAKKFQ